MRSPYTLQKPPPVDPPAGAVCPSLWPVQVRWWLKHTPKDDSQVCRSCSQAWPCHSWACWDGQIGDAVHTARCRQAARIRRQTAGGTAVSA